jgi:cyclophilin family peptidyl-prolyl cis-trans isomerase
MARIAAVVATLVALVALMLYVTTRADDEKPPAPPAAAETTEPPCPRVDAPPSDPEQYEGDNPYPDLKTGVDYAAVITTSCGDIEMDLAEEQAKHTVASFVFLAKEGYFDGLTWHRVVGGFVIQTGDPNGRNGEAPDGPGYTIPDELEGVKDSDYRYGTVAMANSGPNTSGSQFFIVVHDREDGEPAGLDAAYTIFAQVEEGSFDVIDAISRQPVKGGDDPVTAEQPRVPVYIESIEIIEN